MAFAYPGDSALEYYPCRYGKSKLLFRGPRRDLEKPYVAFLGGTETYGKFIPRPFPALVESELAMTAVNLGCVNAGLDVYFSEPQVTQIAAAAQVTVIQIVGAQNLSNRFYAVHPRRNDRFLRASNMLRSVFREVDFTEFNFTRHMLQALQEVSAAKFEVVAEELRAAWVARMTGLLSRLPGKTVLLWMADQAPQLPGARANLVQDPLLIDAEMIAVVRTRVSAYVECISTPAALAAGVQGMAYSDFDAPAAAGMLGPAVHSDVAAALTPVIESLI